MACGCGKISIAVISTILAVAILVLIRIFEVRIMPKNLKHLRKVKISFICKYSEYEEVYKKFNEIFPEVLDYNHKTVDEEGDSLKINAKVFCNEKSPVMHIYKQLDDMKTLKSVSVKEIFE